MSQRPKAVPASYLILRRGDEILLMMRKNTGYFDGWYCVPSGHVEEGEMPIDALVRETKEEVGLDLDRASAKLIHTMFRMKHDETGPRADYFFEVTTDPGEPINQEPEKCDYLKWVSIHALPDNLMPHIHEALRCIADHVPYMELGLDRIVLNPSSKAL